MVDIHLAGGVVRLDGPGVETWARGLGPFLVAPRADCEFCVEIAVEVGDPAPIAGDFSWRRFDLAFALTGDRGRAVHGGHPDGLHAILELALAAALPDGLLLHAGAGVVDGRAWLLPGPSGTGKSTAIRAGRFERVLSDERIIARRRGDRWWAWGTPWWSSGRQPALDPGPVPIAGLVRLHHADAGSKPWHRPCPADRAAEWLLGAVSLYDERPPARRAAFDAACDLVEAIDAIELAFSPDADWTGALVNIGDHS